MSWMKITCGDCGQSADINNWTQTPVYGDLPRNHYQCPNCGTAFERKVGPGEWMPWGVYHPGSVELVPVAARM
jgi:ribosomal protein S27AE